jgi:hypothetical protein
MMRDLLQAALCLALLTPIAACDNAQASRSLAERETLADGREVVRYTEISHEVVDTLVPDLRIGRLEGDGPETFGNVRALEAASDGTIYVLDGLAREVRVFAPDGTHVRTLTRQGEGPGELREANGILLGPDGTLWVQDFRARALIGLAPEGGERVRHPMMVAGYGYLWEAAIDHEGVFRQRWQHAVERSFDMSATGIWEAQSRIYVKSFDPRAQTYDSIFLGEATARSFRIAYENGQSVVGLPFGRSPVVVVGPAGEVWTADSGGYRITRLSAAGDTVLTIEVDELPPPVTDADRDAWREGMSRIFERTPHVQGDMEALIPEVKPLLTRLVADDQGRLWVGRTVPAGEPPLYDVFLADGEHLGSVRLPGDVNTAQPPIIRGQNLYAVLEGELDVPYVMRAALPSWSEAP